MIRSLCSIWNRWSYGSRRKAERTLSVCVYSIAVHKDKPATRHL